MDVIDYTVIVQFTPEDLSKRVASHLQHGWQPWGAPSLAIDPNGHRIFAQAVVKYASKSPAHQ